MFCFDWLAQQGNKLQLVPSSTWLLPHLLYMLLLPLLPLLQHSFSYSCLPSMTRLIHKVFARFSLLVNLCDILLQCGHSIRLLICQTLLLLTLSPSFSLSFSLHLFVRVFRKYFSGFSLFIQLVNYAVRQNLQFSFPLNCFPRQDTFNCLASPSPLFLSLSPLPPVPLFQRSLNFWLWRFCSS